MKSILSYITSIMLFMPLILHASSVKEIINLPVTFFDHENTIKTVITAYEFPANAVDDKKVIVIDAGHGGHDPGAMGKYSKEKDIALEIALKLGAMISEHHTFDVRYTRKNDVFIPLHKRIGQANDYKADLFISIHCNYVDNPHVCGTETFVMGLHKAEENLQVAKRENSAILMESEFESVYEGYDPNSPIGHILLSMFQNIHLDNSITLASHIEGKLNNRNKTKSRGVKQAGFVVLKRATMPSILVETGFLSNPKEEQYLMSTNGQEEMAMAISNGVLMYFDALLMSAIVNQSANQTNKILQENEDIKQGKFTIQLGVFSKIKDDKWISSFENYGKVTVEKLQNGIRYMVGNFHNREDADAICNTIKTSGHKDVFVRSIATE